MGANMRWMKALAAFVALLALVVGVPTFLVAFIGNPWPPEGLDLMAPLTDNAVIGILAAAAWLLWAQLIVCIVIEVVNATSRQHNYMQAAGVFGFQQVLARALVTSIAFAIISVPGSAVTSQPASAATATQPAGTVENKTDTMPVTVSDEVASQNVLDGQPQDAEAQTTTVTVQRGDTVWGLAEKYLGAGDRYREIIDLNQGETMTDGSTFRPADLLVPGWELRLPAGASGEDDGQVEVQPGDSLWSIAEDEYGSGKEWTRIWQANKGTEFDDGRRLRDPDLIQPGWDLDVPAAASRSRAPTPPADARSSSQHEAAEPPSRLASERSTAAAEDAQPEAPEAAALDEVDEVADEAGEFPSWVLPGLLGAGSLLAAGVLLTLRARRTASRRHRRPGRVPVATPPGAAVVEKSLNSTGPPQMGTLQLVQKSLRRLASALAEEDHPVPEVAAVELTDAAFAIHLLEPTAPPAGWDATEDHLTWLITRTAAEAAPAPEPREDPWPLLVTVGEDQRGSVWLLNLESAYLAVDGDPTAVSDFTRFLAAEIACNPWSMHAIADLIGTAEEVVAMNPTRLRHHRSDTSDEHVAHIVSTLDRLTADQSVTAARVEQCGDEAWPARLLLTNTDTEPSGQLTALVAQHPGRSGAAVVRHGADPDALALTVTADRELTIPAVGLTLTAVGLSQDEAAGCATLLAHAERTDHTDAPDLAGEEEWQEFSTSTGALRDQFRTPRDVDTLEPARSVLPEPDETYTTAGAALVDDLAALAPQVTDSTGSNVRAADPTLDADLDDWNNDTTSRPKLQVLGDVAVRTSSGWTPDRSSAYYAEMLAFITTRERGATSAQIAEAFNLTPASVRARVSGLRRLLGSDPIGGDYLKDARTTGTYRVPGTLSDMDLFRRLRVRGEASGQDGMTDLICALELVAGEPFSQHSRTPGRSDGREREGFVWLTDDPVDQHMVCAIADVAHVVATHALAAADTVLARQAIDAAMLAAGGDGEEITRLDLARVLEAEGDTEAAVALVRDALDPGDLEAPGDPSERIRELLRTGSLPKAI